MMTIPPHSLSERSEEREVGGGQQPAGSQLAIDEALRYIPLYPAHLVGGEVPTGIASNERRRREHYVRQRAGT